MLAGLLFAHAFASDTGIATLPRNADEIPLLDAEAASPEEARQADLFARERYGGFGKRVATLSSLAAEPEIVGWLVDQRRPGRGWEAIQPTNRLWLQIIGRLDPAILGALLQGRSDYEFPLDGSGTDLSLLFPDDRVAEDAIAYVRRKRVWFPVPMLLLQTGFRTQNGDVEGPTLGFPPSLVKLLLGGRLRAWQDAAPFFRSMRTFQGCAVRVHVSPAISEEGAVSAAEGICAQTASISRWIGFEARQADVFVYSEGEREGLGLPPWDFALPRFSQVHQGEHSTRGHEVAHVLLQQAWGQQGSAWAGEGIATLLNGDFDPVGRACQQLPDEFDFDVLAADFAFDDESYYAAAVVAAFVSQQFGGGGVQAYYQSRRPRETIATLAGVDAAHVGERVDQWFDERCALERKGSKPSPG